MSGTREVAVGARPEVENGAASIALRDPAGVATSWPRHAT